MSWNGHVATLMAIVVVSMMLHGKSLSVLAENAYGDHGTIVTGVLSIPTFNQVEMYPATPEELANAPTSFTSSGFQIPGYPYDFAFSACDVDYSRNELYLLQWRRKDIIVATNINSSMIASEIEWSYVHTASEEMYSRIALDWVSHNIYWTDPQLSWIAMKPGGVVNDANLYHVIANDDVFFPMGVAVDPLAGSVFWTDYGPPGKIERSGLSGADRKVIVKKGLQEPRCIAADPVSQRIFWTDKTAIVSATYEGKHIETYNIDSTTVDLWDIAVFHDIVLVADHSGGTKIYFYNKNTGVEYGSALEAPLSIYLGVCVYHGDTQPDSPAGDLCSSNGCQDSCVQEPAGGSAATPTCVCREGSATDPSDPKMCNEVNGVYHRALILNNKKQLWKQDIRILVDTDKYTPVIFYDHSTIPEDINFIEPNMETRDVYFATQNKVYSVPIDQANTIAAAVLTSTAIDHTITGLSYDWVNGQLYWTESKDGTDGSINKLDIATGVNIKLSSMADARAITVVPHEMKMLWIDGNDIKQSDLAGPIGPITTFATNLSEPFGIVIDVKYNQLQVLEKAATLTFNYDGECLYTRTVPNNADLDIYQEYMLQLQKDTAGVATLTSSDRWFTATPRDSSYDVIVSGVDGVHSVKILDQTVLQPVYKTDDEDEGGDEQGKLKAADDDDDDDDNSDSDDDDDDQGQLAI